MKKTIKWIIILALVGGGAYGLYQSKMKKKIDGKPTYDRVKVETRNVRIIVESTGEVQPRNRLDIKPPIGGRLEELLVDEGDPAEAGQIIGWVSSTERATLLDAARATSTDEYEYWKKLYKPTPLISPLKGTVIARNFEPGQSIEAKDAVVAIADDLIVVASLDETDIGQVKLAQTVNVRLEAYPDNEFAGIVEKMAYDARTVQNVTMYEVDVRPDNLPLFARSGMTANLEFVIQEKAGVLAVPAAAIMQGASGFKGGSKGGSKNGGGGSDPDRREKMMTRMRESGMSDADIKERLAQFQSGGGKSGEKRGGGKGGSGSYVLVATADPEKPEQKPVKIGISDGAFTEILEGLEEGEEVLIQKIKISSGKPGGSSSPFTPSMGGRGGR